MQLLPKWVLPPTMPAIYDLESGTALEMTAKVYGAMNTLIEEYNKFADSVNEHMKTFTESETEKRTEFEKTVTELYRQFQCQMDMYLRLNLSDTVEKLLFDGMETGKIKIPTDPELSMEKIPADAKATGEEIARRSADLAAQIATERTRIDNLSTLKEGSTTGDAELQDIRVEYNGNVAPNAGTAVRNQIQKLHSTIAGEKENQLANDEFSRASKGHFYKINTDCYEKGVLYNEGAEGIVEANSTHNWTGIIKCPKVLCFDFKDAAARMNIYFYRKTAAGFEVVWDIKKTATSTGLLNYFSPTAFPGGVFEIPDDIYMNVCIRVPGVDLYGWDGESFGITATGCYSTPHGTVNTEVAYQVRTSGITIPGTAKAVICKNGGAIITINAVKDGQKEIILNGNRAFFVLPGGYDYFRARLCYGYDQTAKTHDYTVAFHEVSEYVTIVCEAEVVKPVARAAAVVSSAQAVNKIRWEAKANRTMRNGNHEFSEGTTYTGIPYGATFNKASLPGWHISLHTFLSATNDPDSIFYNEDSSNSAPFYGTDCALYASMCDGWPYPQTLAGYFVDPACEAVRSNNPELGVVFTDKYHHALIPTGTTHGKNWDAYSVCESYTPVTSDVIRYSFMPDTAHNATKNGNLQYDYLNAYGWAVFHKDSTGKLDAPYMKLADLAAGVNFANGDARPYRGDKCVYTSADATAGGVLVNIKNNATVLYIKHPNGTVTEMSVDAKTRVDVSGELSTSGIYHIYTDTNETTESFEFVVLPVIKAKVTENNIFVTDTGGNPVEFWYILADAEAKNKNVYDYAVDDGSGVIDRSKAVNIPYKESGDYKDWLERVNITGGMAYVFMKGTYGAYVVHT